MASWRNHYPDHRQRLFGPSKTLRGLLEPKVEPSQGPVSNAGTAGSTRTLPTDLEAGGSLLAPVRLAGRAREKLGSLKVRYNREIRPHWALQPEEGGDPVTAKDVYCGGRAIQLPKWQPWAAEAKRKRRWKSY